MRSVIAELHRRYFTLDQALKAAETWSKRTTEAPSFRKLVANQSKFQLALRKHWVAQSQNTDQFVNWAAYSVANIQRKQAASKQVTVTDSAGNSLVMSIDSAAFINEQTLLAAIMTQYVLQATALGVADTNEQYVDSGLSITSQAVVKEATDNSAKLVTGITETTRNNIQQSISTSLKLGEDINAAQARLSSTIDDPYRSEMIARTETRNSYVQGANLVAEQTGATGKEWDPSSDPCELCQENVDDGVISIDDDFTNGDEPHPNCLCGRPIYTYDNGDESDSDTEDTSDNSDTEDNIDEDQVNSDAQDLVNAITPDDTEFGNNISNIASDLNTQAIHGPIKTVDRIAEKAINDYGGDVSKVQDAVRGTIVLQDPTEIDQYTQAISDHYPVTRIKNNLDSTGYQDAKVNITLPSGNTGEIQLATPEMLNAKYQLGGEALYHETRVPGLSPEDQAAKLDQMNALYQQAAKDTAARLGQ